SPLADAVEEPGQGVRAIVDGIVAKLGRPQFCDTAREAAAVAAADPSASLIGFRFGDRRHVFALRQQLRPDAASVVARLRRSGLAIEILWGDRVRAVEQVAATLAVDACKAGLTPADKVARIREHAHAGKKVLMVGDGLNDAPALAAASVSLSPV